jgi:hypothetical protein
MPLKFVIPLEFVALVLALLVVSLAEAKAAAPPSTRPSMSCLIMSITLQVHLGAHACNRRSAFLSASRHGLRRQGRTGAA